MIDYFADRNQDAFETLSREALLALISNVIMFEVPESQGKEYHFRIMMDTTSSFRYLVCITKPT